MNILKYPKLNLEEYTNLFLDNNVIELQNQTINLWISGGGLADLYAFGVLFVIHNLLKKNKLNIRQIYTTSGGSIVSFLIILVMNKDIFEDKYKKNIDDIFSIVNNNLRKKYINNCYVVDNLIEIIEEIIPPDLYLLCNNKLFITIHTFSNGFFQHKNIDKYFSNEHLINTIRCSCAIPYISVNTLFNIYKDPNTNKTFYSFDGIYPEIIDTNHKILCINVLFHKYPIFSRFRIYDKFYEFLPLEGIYDTIQLLKFSKECQYVYFYKKQTWIQYILYTFFTISVFMIQQFFVFVFQI